MVTILNQTGKGGQIGIVDKIINAINVIKDISNDYKYDVESILYAFASKFLSGKDLERVKEVKVLNGLLRVL